MFKVGDRVWNKKKKCLDTVQEVMYESYVLESDIRFTVGEQDLHQTAQTMFEELGYLDQGGDEWHHDKLDKNIYFDVDKTISCYSYHANIPTVRNKSMTIDEFKASYQMCIEKGWL